MSEKEATQVPMEPSVSEPPPERRPPRWRALPLTVAAAEYARENNRLLSLGVFLDNADRALERIRQTARVEAAGDGAAFRASVRRQLELKEGYDVLPEDLGLWPYVSMVAEILLARHVDNFLSYVGDALNAVYASTPEALKSGKTLTWKQILEAPDLDTLRRQMAETRVNELAYLGLEKLCNTVTRELNIDLMEAADLPMGVQYVEWRNVVIHNRSIVSKLSAQRCKELEPLVGKQLRLRWTDALDAQRLFGHNVARFDTAIGSKYNLDMQLRQVIHPDLL